MKCTFVSDCTVVFEALELDSTPNFNWINRTVGFTLTECAAQCYLDGCNAVAYKPVDGADRDVCQFSFGRDHCLGLDKVSFIPERVPMLLQCVRCGKGDMIVDDLTSLVYCFLIYLADGLLAITPPPKVNVSTGLPVNVSHVNIASNIPLETSTQFAVNETLTSSANLANGSKIPFALNENDTNLSAFEISTSHLSTIEVSSPHLSTVEISSSHQSELTSASITNSTIHEVTTAQKLETTSKASIAIETSPPIETSSKIHDLSTSLKPGLV